MQCNLNCSKSLKTVFTASKLSRETTTIILFAGELDLDEGGIVMPLDNVCNNTEAGDIDNSYVYSLIAVVVLLDILSLIICLFFIDHFGTDTRIVAMKHYIKEPIKSTFEIFTHWKIIC